MSDTANSGLANAQKIIAAIQGLVEVLGPLESDERSRVIQGALVVLREPSSAILSTAYEHSGASVDLKGVAAKAQLWMKQNKITSEQLAQVFDSSEGETTVILSELPGKNNSEKTIKAYVLTGIASLVSTGEAKFLDKAARELCETLGCYDSSNHSKYMKDKGSNFVGDKDKGWKLTAPGLKAGANIVKELSSAADA